MILIHTFLAYYFSLHPEEGYVSGRNTSVVTV